MRTISQAFLWETAAKGKWIIPGFLFFANLMPFGFYQALSQIKFVNYHDEMILKVSVSLIIFNAFLFMFGIFWSQGDARRLYGMPISNGTLTLWQLLPAAVACWLEATVSLLFLDYYFHLELPIWGPALFAAAFCVVTQSLFMAGRISFSGTLAMIALLMLLCFGLYAAHGGWFGKPTHYWTEVTLSQVVSMIAIAGISFWISVRSTEVDRCGETYRSFAWSTALRRRWQNYIDRQTIVVTKFRSPAAAQFWCDWSSKGWAFPILFGIFFAFFAVGGSLDLLFRPDFDAVQWVNRAWDFLLGTGILLSVIAMASGLFLGLCSFDNVKTPRDPSMSDLFRQAAVYDMGSFQATRPIPSMQFASAILKTAARSVFMTWSLWIGLCALFLGISWLTVGLPTTFLITSEWRWALPMTLLGPWIVINHTAIAGLTGRLVQVTYGIFLLLVSYVLAALAAQTWLSPSTIAEARQAIGIFASALVVSITFWAFAAALLKNHLRRPLVSVAILVAAGIVILAIALRPVELTLIHYFLIAAIAALTIGPIAFTPLAIAWNRHR